MSNSNLYNRLGGEESVSKLIDSFYEKMTDDYRISRFFNDDDKKTQRSTLKALAKAILEQHSPHTPEFKKLLTNFFMSAFARFKDKERLPESGFAYFGYIIGQNNPSSKFLCDSHSHLLKFIPEDSHYDLVMMHLTDSLQSLNVDPALMKEVLVIAESGRSGLLGK
ncbi:MAG: hemoglobin [Pseudomonadota bacterium]|nr:hemoglobin [Pseudomonadota bacterium]